MSKLTEKKTVSRLITMIGAAAMMSATLSAEQYDRLLDAIDVPDGAYFDTGYVVKNHPRVIADLRADWTAGTEDLDVFGVAPRGEGCWILMALLECSPK